jgi:serine phosphatase RsbU (regulator of sigma subunit)/Tfp pilus assembly protein PilF
MNIAFPSTRMTFPEIDELNISAWEKRRSALRESFDLAMRAKDAAEQSDYTKGIADSSKALGYCYWRFSDYSSSLTHSLRALKIYKELNAQKDEADTLNSIGAVYMFQKDHAKRLECNLRCLKIRQDVGDEEGVSGSQNNIGETYFEMGDAENASKWFYASLENAHVSEQIKAWATHNLGKVYISLKNFDKAESRFAESLITSENANYDVLSAVTCLELARLFFTKGDFAKSEHYAFRGLSVAEKIGSKEEIKNALFLAAQVKESTGDLNSALSFYKKHHDTHIEIFNEVNTQRIRDIEFQYEIERITKEAEIERLKTVELRAANLEIENQKRLLEHRNNEIIDSIKYARRIQQALLKDEEHISQHLPPHFILYKPKDIVSGDFYWALEKGEYLYVAVADCTGHGVPGAFLTMLGTSYINEITGRDDLPSPAQVLDELRAKFVKELGGDGETKDGMDISMLRVNCNTNEIIWSGANNPLWIIRKGAQEIHEIKADKQAIGLLHAPALFTDHELQLNSGDSIYLFTDGFADQFGGERGKKFKYRQLKDVLLANVELPLQEQKEKLDTAFADWRGELEQVDDVCVIGMRIG